VQPTSVSPAPARSAPVTLSPPTVLPVVDTLEETPDADGAFPRLTAAQLARLRRVGRRRTTTAGEVLLHAGGPDYDFVVVLDGTVAVVEAGTDGSPPRVIAVHGPGRFLGGINMLAGQRPARSVVVQEPGAVLTLPVNRLRTVLARDPALANVVRRSFLLRRAMLIGRASGLRVVGDRRWPASRELRTLLDQNGIGHQWLDPAEDAAARALLDEIDPRDGSRPVVVAADGRVLFEPTLDDLVRAAQAARAT
nr:cyclic nucleotide-binding domain-containing protein [Actinomycetota bacterium]